MTEELSGLTFVNEQKGPGLKFPPLLTELLIGEPVMNEQQKSGVQNLTEVVVQYLSKMHLSKVHVHTTARL